MHSPHYYNMPIKLLGLSSVVHGLLEQAGILSVGTLLDRMSGGARMMLSIPEFTPEAVDEVLTKFIQFQEESPYQRDWIGLDQQQIGERYH